MQEYNNVWQYACLLKKTNLHTNRHAHVCSILVIELHLNKILHAHLRHVVYDKSGNVLRKVMFRQITLALHSPVLLSGIFLT